MSALMLLATFTDPLPLTVSIFGGLAIGFAAIELIEGGSRRR
jgi:hypothetical protein